MDNVELRGGKKEKSCTKLLSKLPSEIKWDAPEVSVPQ